jgi:hypothetical protein
MMKTRGILIAPVGASGSGKSFYGEKLRARIPIEIVCPDDIRLELTGDVSDQSRNSEVFKIAYTRARKLIEHDEIVYFSATNLGMKPIRSLLIELRPSATFVMPLWDSEDVGLCIKRVEKDIHLGRTRAATPRNIVMKQHLRFMQFIENLDRVREAGAIVVNNLDELVVLIKELRDA